MAAYGERSERGDREERPRRGNRDRERDSGGDEGGDFRRKRPRPPLDLEFVYKEIDTLRQFIGEGGRIVPSRINRLNRTQQRSLATHVKRARMLALLPIADSHRIP